MRVPAALLSIAHDSLLACCSTVTKDQTQITQHYVPESYLQDPLQGHVKFRKIADLSVGSSAFVILAEDTEFKEEVAIKFVDRASSRCKSHNSQAEQRTNTL